MELVEMERAPKLNIVAVKTDIVTRHAVAISLSLEPVAEEFKEMEFVPTDPAAANTFIVGQRRITVALVPPV